MKYGMIIYEVKEQIARITLNRPEKMNAINNALWMDLCTVFEDAENDPRVRVIVLSGAGPAFCTGWDLKESPYTTIPEGYERWETGNSLKTLRDISAQYLKIMNLRKPTIAKIRGYCLAAGCYLQMFCDIAIADERAIFGHPASFGGADSCALWVWFLGARKAKELLMTRRFIDGKEAERIGLINRAVPADKLEEEVWAMAKDIAVVPTDDDPSGGPNMSILKELINTDMDIMGLGALFRYHRQLNAWTHRDSGKGGVLQEPFR